MAWNGRAWHEPRDLGLAAVKVTISCGLGKIEGWVSGFGARHAAMGDTPF